MSTKEYRIIIFGPQGSGKGTQADKLSAKFNIPHISTGDLFRQAVGSESELGKEVRGYLKAGQLVPDETTVKLLKERLSQPDAQHGYILDGYPRNQKQLEYLQDNFSEPNFVVALEIREVESIKRIASRRVCPKCGANYNMISNPPKVDETCDKCGTKVVQREDDRPEAISKRLETYHQQTAPLLDYYAKQGVLARIDGQGGIDEVFEKIINKIK